MMYEYLPDLRRYLTGCGHNLVKRFLLVGEYSSHTVQFASLTAFPICCSRPDILDSLIFVNGLCSSCPSSSSSVPQTYTQLFLTVTFTSFLSVCLHLVQASREGLLYNDVAPLLSSRN